MYYTLPSLACRCGYPFDGDTMTRWDNPTPGCGCQRINRLTNLAVPKSCNNWCNETDRRENPRDDTDFEVGTIHIAHHTYTLHTIPIHIAHHTYTLHTMLMHGLSAPLALCSETKRAAAVVGGPGPRARHTSAGWGQGQGLGAGDR
jgi:hypothetical protein